MIRALHPDKPKLVVIGNGMAGARLVEDVLSLRPDLFDITVFGDEPYGNYNRILLSNVLNGSQDAKEIFLNPLAWYEENGITLHAGKRVTATSCVISPFAASRPRSPPPITTAVLQPFA